MRQNCHGLFSRILFQLRWPFPTWSFSSANCLVMLSPLAEGLRQNNWLLWTLAYGVVLSTKQCKSTMLTIKWKWSYMFWRTIFSSSEWIWPVCFWEEKIGNYFPRPWQFCARHVCSVYLVVLNACNLVNIWQCFTYNTKDKDTTNLDITQIDREAKVFHNSILWWYDILRWNRLNIHLWRITYKSIYDSCEKL